jgi:hypothetical protein
MRAFLLESVAVKLESVAVKLESVADEDAFAGVHEPAEEAARL